MPSVPSLALFRTSSNIFLLYAPFPVAVISEYEICLFH
jgi:hypothetical protein